MFSRCCELPGALIVRRPSVSSAIWTPRRWGLGLGCQPPTPEWGTMLSGSLGYMQRAPWGRAFPGLAILITVLAFNLMGDGLRDDSIPK